MSSCSFYITLHQSLRVLPYKHKNEVSKIKGRDFLADFSAKKSDVLA